VRWLPYNESSSPKPLATHFLAFLDPSVDDLWSQLIRDDLLLAREGPGGAATDRPDAGTKKRLSRLFVLASNWGRIAGVLVGMRHGLRRWWPSKEW